MTDKFKSFLGHYWERLAIKGEYAPVYCPQSNRLGDVFRHSD